MEVINTTYIYSSGLIVSSKPLILSTVLGSCISICLWDMKNKIGGMNHYMLPYWNGSGLASPKYGNIAIPQLLKKMKATQHDPGNIIAKVFGGARMLKDQSAIFDIGHRNTQLAYEMLAAESIKIIAESTGGEKGRKIFFNTETGEVYLKFL
ncbi:MAG: chemotaxis protein CheD [Bacteroidales bacterium]|nr:chemotaxis protein CheD [Bacteroidales bacterium]